MLLYPDFRSHKTCCLHTFCNVFLTYISNSVEIPVFYFECENLWQFCLYLVKFSIIYSMAEISFALWYRYVLHLEGQYINVHLQSFVPFCLLETKTVTTYGVLVLTNWWNGKWQSVGNVFKVIMLVVIL